MAEEVMDGNLENCLVTSESPLTNINTIWDLRKLLKSSEKRLEELKRTSIPDKESMLLDRAIIKGVSKEIKKLEREALYCDTFQQ